MQEKLISSCYGRPVVILNEDGFNVLTQEKIKQMNQNAADYIEKTMNMLSQAMQTPKDIK